VSWSCWCPWEPWFIKNSVSSLLRKVYEKIIMLPFERMNSMLFDISHVKGSERVLDTNEPSGGLSAVKWEYPMSSGSNV